MVPHLRGSVGFIQEVLPVHCVVGVRILPIEAQTGVEAQQLLGFPARSGKLAHERLKVLQLVRRLRAADKPFLRRHVVALAADGRAAVEPHPARRALALIGRDALPSVGAHVYALRHVVPLHGRDLPIALVVKRWSVPVRRHVDGRPRMLRLRVPIVRGLRRVPRVARGHVEVVLVVPARLEVLQVGDDVFAQLYGRAAGRARFASRDVAGARDGLLVGRLDGQKGALRLEIWTVELIRGVAE